MALMTVMTLSLLVYSALEFRIRQALKQKQKTFKSHLGAPTTKPTVRWVFQFFAAIHVLLCDGCKEIVLNCNTDQLKLIRILGEPYTRLYANSE
jgi:transposase